MSDSDWMASPLDLEQAIRKRRMRRAFASTPLDNAMLMEILDLSRRAPSAGNTQSCEFLVLDSPQSVQRYWDVTLPEPRRRKFRWQELLSAPVLVVITVSPSAYVRRYAEADKARPGLGESTGGWTVPYWWVDGGAVAQNLLLLATDRSLGACLFGLFDYEERVKQAFGVPEERRCVATVALGYPVADEPGRSASRQRPPIESVVHQTEW